MNRYVDPNLVEAYARTLYEVRLPSGAVVLRVEARAIGDVGCLLGRSVAVVTAYNPGLARPSEDENRRANGRLEREIEERRWEYYPALGYSPDRSHQEPSFAILDLSDDEARALGARYGQAAVFFWDGARGRLVWCD